MSRTGVVGALSQMDSYFQQSAAAGQQAPGATQTAAVSHRLPAGLQRSVPQLTGAEYLESVVEGFDTVLDEADDAAIVEADALDDENSSPAPKRKKIVPTFVNSVLPCRSECIFLLLVCRDGKNNLKMARVRARCVERDNIHN
jgi:hypothetical protein